MATPAVEVPGTARVVIRLRDLVLEISGAAPTWVAALARALTGLPEYTGASGGGITRGGREDGNGIPAHPSDKDL